MILGQNQYGKAETRVVRITRDGPTHHIKDLTVSVALSGDMADVHLSGSNANVLTTDTTKNTVFAFAKEHGIASAEQFGIRLARHFVTNHDPITRARIRIEEHTWGRIPTPGPKRHSFVRGRQETRTAQVTHDDGGWEVLTGLKHLTVLNSTDSEFTGYAKDRYTTLPETRDRVLATEVHAVWRHAAAPGTAEPDPATPWDGSYERIREHLLQAFATTYSLSLQQTLYRMGERVLQECPGIDEIRLSLPNKHHFLVDLEPFGLKNDHEVYYAADRPYGLIEATVLRDGARPRIPVDVTNLP
ncbi:MULTISPECIES: factor-independent urate hydroxylase [Streptomyces]|uniref:Uricase n=1 Tax=Streptomyces luteosporeus TaxID=173856 RepID=A0ABN3TZ48_9ACTN